jgi:hypothetical protein
LAYRVLVKSPYEALAYPIFAAHRCIDLSCNLERHLQWWWLRHIGLVSDEDCKVVGLNVSGDNGSIISIETKDLAAFSKAESDCKKKTIHLVAPATKSHPYFELKSTSKTGHLTLAEKKVKVSPDWQM